MPFDSAGVDIWCLVSFPPYLAFLDAVSKHPRETISKKRGSFGGSQFLTNMWEGNMERLGRKVGHTSEEGWVGQMGGKACWGRLGRKAGKFVAMGTRGGSSSQLGR